MRLAVLTDIHANREALSAVLQDAAVRQIDRFVILGDIVGYGPDPEWCTDRVMALAQSGAICIRGNHDEAAILHDDTMSTNARLAIEWTRPRLSADQKAFLAALPLTAELEDLLFVHASANEPGSWMYVSSDIKATGSFRSSTARVVFCGHVHRPMLVSCDRTGMVREQIVPTGAKAPLIRSRRWLAVVGSVGQPRDRSPKAGYAVYDTVTNDLSFLRVTYDVATTIRKIRQAGLPEALATRLMTGV